MPSDMMSSSMEGFSEFDPPEQQQSKSSFHSSSVGPVMEMDSPTKLLESVEYIQPAPARSRTQSQMPVDLDELSKIAGLDLDLGDDLEF